MRVFKPTYRDRHGRTRTTRRWYIEFNDPAGHRRRLPGFADRRTAERVGMQLEIVAERLAAGLPPSSVGEESIRHLPDFLTTKLRQFGMIGRQPLELSELLERYRAHLEALKRTPLHITNTIGRCERAVSTTAATRLEHLTAERIEPFLAKVRTRLSCKTANHYLASLKAFCEWCVATGELATNPLARVKRFGARQRKRVRRALSEDEFAALIRVCPPHHALLYRVASYSGYRAGELAELRWQDVRDGGLVLAGESTKNSHDAFVPLPRSLYGLLCEVRENFRDDEPIFEWFDRRRGAELIKRDLGIAGLAYKTAEGVADFHALRHLFCTRLLRAGATPNVVRELMRHSAASLTLELYGHAYRDELRSAVERIAA